MQRTFMQQTLPIAVRGGAFLALMGSVIAVIVWLERTVAPGSGGLWLALTAVLGGIGVELAQRRHGKGATCLPGPRMQPLQVSCLALQATGVLLYHSAQNAIFAATFPILTATWLPLACILGGVLGLGILSISGSCRDADFAGRV